MVGGKGDGPFDLFVLGPPLAHGLLLFTHAFVAERNGVKVPEDLIVVEVVDCRRCRGEC